MENKYTETLCQDIPKDCQEQQRNSLAVLLICPSLNLLITTWVGMWEYLPKLQGEREHKLQKCCPEVQRCLGKAGFFSDLRLSLRPSGPCRPSALCVPALCVVSDGYQGRLDLTRAD